MCSSAYFHLSTPPLIFPPVWTTAQSPDVLDVRYIHQEATEIHAHVAPIHMALNTVSSLTRADLAALPTAQVQSRLQDLVSILREMSYPAHLTDWINTGRILASRAATHFDDAIGNLQRLYRLYDTSKEYQDCLNELRGLVAEIINDLDALLIHLAQYIAIAEHVQLPAMIAEESLATDVQRHSTNATPHDQGWQAGMREALDLVQLLLQPYTHMQADPLSPSLCTPITRLIAELHQRIDQASAPSQPELAAIDNNAALNRKASGWDTDQTREEGLGPNTQLLSKAVG